jgi:hypothetical protein
MWSASSAWRKPSVYDSIAVDMMALYGIGHQFHISSIDINRKRGAYLWKFCS